MNIIPHLDHESKMPLHQQAEEVLRKLINEKHFQSGYSFPKETDLAKRWGISRNTLRQAISNLVREGLLERKKRLGTRVSKKKITTDLSNWLSFTHEMENQGVPFKNLSYSVSKVKVNEEIARHLQIEERSSVILLKRIRSTGRSPMVHFESYFHPRIGLSAEENFEQPLYDLLDKKYHIIPAYSQEEIRAIAANSKMSGLLKIKQGTPVLERKRIVLDAGRRPIEYNVCFYRSDCFTYTIEIKTPAQR